MIVIINVKGKYRDKNMYVGEGERWYLLFEDNFPRRTKITRGGILISRCIRVRDKQLPENQT